MFNTTDYVITAVRSDTASLPELPQLILKLLFGGTPTAGETVRISALAKQQSRNTKILQEMRTAAMAKLEADGFMFAQFGTGYSWRRAVYVVAGVVVAYFLLETIIFAVTALLTLVIFFGMQYKRRTAKGYEAENHLKGFKLFLSVTDKERFAFHNAPAKNPELFMAYLPYAIALKVEEEWAEVFADITIPNPAWYDGGAVGAFNVASFTSDIGAFSTAFAASSGTSGSRGGGSAGGGGGGGGGGSW